jgi:hypothetical protein
MASPMHQAALQLAARGLWVFPCRPRDKRPATARGLKDATTDPAIIERWWRQQPDFNVGVVTGAASRILVVDVDDIDAEAELKKLEAQYSALPATVESVTTRGRHLFFRWPEREVRNSASKIAPGVDIRGEGGYIVAPPSVHPSGKRYAWSVDSASEFADVPDWLLDRITAPAGGADATMAATAWRDMVRDGIGEGCRNDGIARLAGHLLQRRVDPEVALELVLAFNDARCRPPLRRAEAVAVVDSIAALELKKRFNA